MVKAFVSLAVFLGQPSGGTTGEPYAAPYVTAVGEMFVPGPVTITGPNAPSQTNYPNGAWLVVGPSVTILPEDNTGDIQDRIAEAIISNALSSFGNPNNTIYVSGPGVDFSRIKVIFVS